MAQRENIKGKLFLNILNSIKTKIQIVKIHLAGNVWLHVLVRKEERSKIRSNIQCKLAY